MSTRDRYDHRPAASAVLARSAAPGLFAPVGDAFGGPRRITYTISALAAEPGSHLTLSQRMYLDRFMRPCRPEQVTSATHRITWTDSDAIPNTGHYGPSGLGAVVPIAARETVLALWRGLAANRHLAQAALALCDDDLDVLATTTTDQEPLEIFRIGVEATGRALTQHALLAHHTGYDTAAGFAAALHRSGLFGAVAASWYWELQASTYRRGMIPVALQQHPDGRVGYTANSSALPAAMKRHTIADAPQTMRRAMTEEGLTAAKYHTELDLISKQYALMDPDTRPRCLALMPNTVNGTRFNVLTMVVDTFTRMLDLVEIRPTLSAPSGKDTADRDRRFQVPDMNCKHCRVTIAAVLESHGVEVADINLVTEQVVAQFDTIGQRDAAFSLIRDSGYTVIVIAGDDR